MRIEQRKPKTQETVGIPGDFALYLKEACREIVAGDEPAILESDDRLQYEEFDCAYGGLIDSETGEDGFRYFTDNENGITWDIHSSKSEIEKIVTGEITELTL